MTPLLLLAAPGVTAEPLADAANEKLAKFYAQFKPTMMLRSPNDFLRVRPVWDDQERRERLLKSYDDIIRQFEGIRDRHKDSPKLAAEVQKQIDDWKGRRERLKALLGK